MPHIYSLCHKDVKQRRPCSWNLFVRHLEIFNHQPGTRLESRHHARQDRRSIGQMHDDQSCVNEIKCLSGKKIRCDVVSQDLEVLEMQRFEESRVDVSRDDVTGRTDPVGHPTCDGTTTGADFKAAPPLLDATSAEMSDRARVEDIGEGAKSACSLLGTSAVFATTQLAAVLPGTVSAQLASAAAIVAVLVYAAAIVGTRWLPEPRQGRLPD